MALTTRIGVISSGRGENARYIIEAARSGYLPAEVAIVLADERDAGALRIARELGVEARFVDPSGLSRVEYDELLIDHLERAGVNLVVLTGYMRILSPEFVRHFKNRTINIHPALLPTFRGLDAFQQALDYGVKVTGTTIHLVDEDVDHGPIILQVPVKVRDDDTHESLKARIQEAEYRAYPQALKLFIEGRPKVVGRKVVFERDEGEEETKVGVGDKR